MDREASKRNQHQLTGRLTNSVTNGRDLAATEGGNWGRNRNRNWSRTCNRNRSRSRTSQPTSVRLMSSAIPYKKWRVKSGEWRVEWNHTIHTSPSSLNCEQLTYLMAAANHSDLAPDTRRCPRRRCWGFKNPHPHFPGPPVPLRRAL